VLIFAGGVRRQGNLLGLHRPYYSRETASKLSDIEYEAALKTEMVRVRDYLQNMEVDSFFTEKLISTNSQDAYVVTLNEAATHHLSDDVPSIEEILLSKCNDLTSQENRLFDTAPASTPEDYGLAS
jgi:hypothetical protein